MVGTSYVKEKIMEMKHFVDSEGKVHGLMADGSQDKFIKSDWKAIKETEVETYTAPLKEALFNAEDYYRKRLYSYPEVGEFLDAWVKGDEAALEEYKQKCLEVKAKFPKPEGF